MVRVCGNEPQRFWRFANKSAFHMIGDSLLAPMETFLSFIENVLVPKFLNIIFRHFRKYILIIRNFNYLTSKYSSFVKIINNK